MTGSGSISGRFWQVTCRTAERVPGCFATSRTSSGPRTGARSRKGPTPEYPWFWDWDEVTEDFAGGTKFDGNRWNDCHYTNRTKQAAREVAKKGGTG